MAAYQPPVKKEVATQHIALILAKSQLGQMTSAEANEQLTALIPMIEADDTPEETPVSTPYADTPAATPPWTPGSAPPSY